MKTSRVLALAAASPKGDDKLALALTKEWWNHYRKASRARSNESAVIMLAKQLAQADDADGARSLRPDQYDIED